MTVDTFTGTFTGTFAGDEGEPTFSAATERLWSRIPAFYREADEAHNWQFKRYISSIADRWGEIDTLRSRFDFVQPGELPKGSVSSDLADPHTADPEWLAWMAQLVGVRLQPSMSTQEKRDAIASSASGYRAGTKAAIADAARTALTGSRFAQVYDHSTPTGIGSGTEWEVLVVTREEETPSPQAVLDTIVRKRAKPAGVVLYHRAYSAMWTTIESTYPAWNNIDGKTWTSIEQTGI